MTHLIKCRAKVSHECLDGKPTELQFGEDGPLGLDGTYDGESIVCDCCYVELMPLTPSGAGLHAELPEAIATYHENVRFLRDEPDPAGRVEQATKAMASATPGSPRWKSARLMRALAQREVDRRQT